MTLFEILYWLAMVAQVVIRAPFSRMHRRGIMRESRVSPQENGLVLLLSAGILFLPLLYSATPWLDSFDYRLPLWAQWLGVAFLGGSLLVFWRAHFDLGANWSPSLEIREDHQLITRGIYRYIRHPMYASEWLWAIAQPLLIPNWVAGLLGCMAFIPFYLLRVRGEEEMMRDSFGEQYEAYARKTGRIFPRLRN